FRLFLAGLLILTLYISWLVRLDADAAKTTDNAIANFRLRDTTGRAVALSDFKEKKAIAVVFLGTQCPLNNQYLSRLAELHKEFAGKGVQFLAINSNVQDTPQHIAEHAQKHEIPFPVLRDEANKVADLFDARRTPEAFVLDAKHVIRYRGRID